MACIADHGVIQIVSTLRPRSRAVFLDRDGVVNELVYYPEHSIVDSPFTPAQFRQFNGVARAVNEFHRLRFKVVIASNQPGVAKGHMSWEMFERVRMKMKEELAKEGAFIDGEYYCFHHPEAKVEELRRNCDCRKPKPGLLLRAASELDIDLSQSWMIGDGLTDLKAGKSAGCKTILIGKTKCELCHLMDGMEIRPDFITADLFEAAQAVSGSIGSIYKLDTIYSKLRL